MWGLRFTLGQKLEYSKCKGNEVGLGARRACSALRKGYSGEGAPGVISSEEAQS